MNIQYSDLSVIIPLFSWIYFTFLFIFFFLLFCRTVYMWLSVIKASGNKQTSTNVFKVSVLYVSDNFRVNNEAADEL